MSDERTIGLRKTLHQLTRRGLRGSISHLWTMDKTRIPKRIMHYIRYSTAQIQNKRWDWSHGVETTSGVATADLKGSVGENTYSVFYAPTPRSTLRFLVEHTSFNPSDFHFIDYGSGKGKVLLLASDYPFKQITGVEFADDLVDIAKQNLASFKSRTCKCTQIEIEHLDAKNFVLPDSKLFLFFYSPFHTKLLDEVLEGIRASIERCPRETIICFVDDLVYNSQVPRVSKMLSTWKHWQSVPMPKIPVKLDTFHPLEAVVYQFHDKG